MEYKMLVCCGLDFFHLFSPFKMVRNHVLLLSAFCVYLQTCAAQFNMQFFRNEDTTTTPLPFPACRADHIDCLRRGLRTFFFLMDSGHLGMTPVDPLTVNSVTVSLPGEQMSIIMRKVNVTGVRWTKLAERKFNLEGGKSGVRFVSDLHMTAEVSMIMASRNDHFTGKITMDIQDVESNITYPWTGERGVDNEDYIIIGPERVAVRNTRTPTYFMQPNSEEAFMIDMMLGQRPSILEHLANEVTTAVMNTVVDNFRLFASKVPVKYYYKYFN